MAQILYVTNILIDFGALAQLKAECERVGITRPLIVTDAGVKAAGLLDKALAALPACSRRCSIRRHPTRPKRPCAPPSRCTARWAATA